MLANDFEDKSPEYLFYESLNSFLSKEEAILLSKGSDTDPLMLSNFVSS